MDLPKGCVSCVQHGKVYEVTGRLSKFQPLAFTLKDILCQSDKKMNLTCENQIMKISTTEVKIKPKLEHSLLELLKKYS
ncbi:hypothetical protein G9A89_009376 [Geosiphon pyriformis]|nr:hypothetical protein G9A89_009376 [Geosiphon pyriformis]